MPRIRALAAALAAGSIALAACGGSSSSGSDSGDAGSSGRGDTLTIGTIATLVNGLSASSSEAGNRISAFQALYDPLLRANPDGSLSPWLATEWSYNDDNTVLTLKLRDDVKFSDGTALDAEAVVGNLTRFQTGKSPDASNLSAMASAKAVDATTVEITLSAPDPAFLNYLGRNAGLIENPASFDAADEETNPLGSGPYVLDVAKTVPDSVYTFKANEDYWAADSIKYDNLVIKVIEDPAAGINAIKAGEVNAINLVNNDALDEIEAAGWDLHATELDWVGLTLVDRDGSLGSPLADVKVRQAMNFAFDRQAILDGYGAGYGTITSQVFRKESAGFDASIDTMYAYDPAKAKALLAEAGYPDGFTIDMPSTTLLGEAVYAIIADQLSEVGITVNHVDETADFFGALLTPKYPAYLMFLEQNGNDWQFINFMLSESAVWNPSHFTDETSADLISKIQTASDSERDALVKELGTYVTEQAWFVPWYRKQSTFVTDGTTDVQLQAGNAVPYLWNFVPQS